ncbi:glycosyltransferase family 1 protein [Rheinheimera baltica]|uniref:Glycosyltransferase family 1 protein n=1 Tax=Rheinheimera baltica TaxID=67576 RepID=A0ABT9I292_9GAMM|nr:glycosyltransferase family 1 protein [Rheinheimera baltica]MDP5137504.1 glycosyltransferase family 1 protein [Rheinheimera baltica]MDP5149745.1 glycosyltransferase family 1 protein [Rheinheimera baltica]
MAVSTECRIFVVEERLNPSTDFFIVPYLGLNCTKIEKYSLTTLPTLRPYEKVHVIFVRYISSVWRTWFSENVQHIQKAEYFIDDDIFDLRAFKSLSLRYAFKLFRFGFYNKSWVACNPINLLVSTPFLAKKYHDLNPTVINPAPPPMQIPQLTVFYHGSASHRRDIQWLKPVVEQVVKQCEHVSFEFIGPSFVNELFRGVERTHVLFPMSWQNYNALLSRGARHIGLAPLLPDAFNAARAPTKFYDITRAGACGIYAKHPVYENIIKHQVNGILLPMDEQQWVDHIVMLSQDTVSRGKLEREAKALAGQGYGPVSH